MRGYYNTRGTPGRSAKDHWLHSSGLEAAPRGQLGRRADRDRGHQALRQHLTARAAVLTGRLLPAPQLARYTGESGHLRARLEEDFGQVLMLRLEIKKLGETMNRHQGQGAHARPYGRTADVAVRGGPPACQPLTSDPLE